MGRIGTNASRTWNDSLRKLKAVSQPSRGRLNRFPRRCRHCSSQTVSRQQLQRALHRIRPAPRDKLVRSNAPSNAPRNRCPCTTCTWSAFASHLKRRKPRWNLYPTLTMPTHREPRWWQSPVLNPLRDRRCSSVGPNSSRWRFRAAMSSGCKCSVGCASIRLPPAGQTPVAMFRQGSPREIRISKSRSLMRAPYHVRIKGVRLKSLALARPARTRKSRYIPFMIAFSVTLGRIAAAHLAASGR